MVTRNTRFGAQRYNAPGISTPASLPVDVAGSEAVIMGCTVATRTALAGPYSYALVIVRDLDAAVAEWRAGDTSPDDGETVIGNNAAGRWHVISVSSAPVTPVVYGLAGWDGTNI